jgi:hypothetical protein
MTLVDTRGELDFGLRLEPAKGLASLELFASHWRNEPDALALMEPDTYALLQRQGLPMVIQASSPGRLIVSHP